MAQMFVSSAENVAAQLLQLLQQGKGQVTPEEAVMLTQLLAPVAAQAIAQAQAQQAQAAPGGEKTSVVPGEAPGPGQGPPGPDGPA